jgi:cytochrome c oxidase subunit 1
VLAYLGGLHYWWSKITGKMYSEFWSKIAAIIVFVGFNLTFFPQFILGYLGMPRRYASYPPEFQVLNIFSTAGASILAIGLILPLIYLTYSIFFGAKAPANPWMLPGLEWRTASPPPTENFETTPIVTWEAYEFGEESGLDLEDARNRNKVLV